ncbi:cob(I)yrinic acid a,c-diamide adenosyltransferase [[Eubacterium] cellulosolvens]
MPRVYTRTGDKGETGLFSGERVPKNSRRVEAYGAVDELSSWIGYARSLLEDRDFDDLLGKVQQDLFLVCADLATRPEKEKPQKAAQVTDAMVKHLEEAIDRFDAELPTLSTFIVPSGTKAAAALHVARAVARRAERRTVTLAQREELNPQVVPYLNRLSSLLFVLARIVNKRSGVEEAKRASRSQ